MPIDPTPTPAQVEEARHCAQMTANVAIAAQSGLEAEFHIVVKVPPPPTINARRGVTQADVEATREHIEALGKQFAHMSVRLLATYKGAVLAAVRNHNENHYGKKTSERSVVYAIDSVVEEFVDSMKDITADITGDITDSPIDEE